MLASSFANDVGRSIVASEENFNFVGQARDLEFASALELPKVPFLRQPQ